MVVAGMPFRDAYKAVAEQRNGTYNHKKPNIQWRKYKQIVLEIKEKWIKLLSSIILIHTTT
jgi:argininosuccinate lyase